MAKKDKKHSEKELDRYKCIKVVNQQLSDDDFEKAFSKLCNLDICSLSESRNVIMFGGKSETKETFSVDSGRITSELNAFILSINHYLGEYLNSVEVIVCD